MKKSIFALLITVIILLVGYGFFAHIFPLAKPLEYDVDFADIHDVLAVEVTPSDGETAGVYGFASLLMQIQNVEPTRKQSVNDYPDAAFFYKVEVITEEKVYQYFVYEESGQVYLEIPYVGIYKGVYSDGNSSLMAIIQDLLIKDRVK